MPTITCRRLVWISFSRLITFFIPNFILHHVGGIKTSASRNAWREKIALFFLFLFIVAVFCFWLEFISSLFCDPEKTYDYDYVFSNESYFTAINGKAVDWHHYGPTDSPMIDYVNQYPHHDLSPNFPSKILMLSRSSPTTQFADDILNDCIYYQNRGQEADAWFDHLVQTSTGYQFQNEQQLVYCPMPGQINQTGAPCFYGAEVDTLVNSLPIKGDIKYDPTEIHQLYNSLPSPGNMTKQGYVILNGYVLDVTAYLSTVTNIIPLSSTLSSRSFAVDRMFLPLDLTLFLYVNLGKDITDYFDGNVTTDNPDLYKRCLIHLFQKGVVPSYVGSGCSRINPALWATMGAGLMYFLIKMNLAYLSRVGFIQRLLFSSAPPELSALSRQEWPHTILMVPCFAESSDTLKQTLDTLSRSAYDDDKKLLLFVCDGITTSAKEQKETHTLLLECLGYSSSDEPIAQPYTSLGQGKKRINYARVYSGYYETGRNRVPYLVIVKLGHTHHYHQQEEQLKGGERDALAGNRGKRDSLVLVFGFLERCINLANNRITPLDYEIFNQCYNVLGIDPRFFKYLLVTDADIQVQSDVVQKLVSRLEGDRHMLAVSGHVRPANPEENLTTMLQIFPVYMAFFSGLAYEACLRSVMTIQGGLVMYKVWTENISHSLLDENKNEKYLKKWRTLRQNGSKATSQQLMQQQPKWPKTSDEIMISNPFQDNSRRSSKSSDTSISTMPITKSKQQRPESRLSLSARVDIRPCCVHPTVLRGIATPQANTMHMQSILLLGEEKIMPIVLLRSHPGHRLGFEPEAVGYATLPTNFFSLQGYATRNLRAAFHTQLEMHRVSWQLGITYWILSTTEILDMIFSMPIIVYLYGVFGRTVRQYGMAYLIITCSFTGLVVLHILFFLLRRQFRYIFWFVLYCLFSVPLFAIWFPLLAVWQSDDANLWYDVWPIKKTKQLGRYYTPGSRLHGILDSTIDNNDRNKDVEKEEQDKEEEEVSRMRLREFEVIEAKRLHQAAEAALDSNFTGFTAATGFIDPSQQQQQEVSALSPPLAVQVREGLHSTRIITNYQRPLSNEMTWRHYRHAYPESPVYTNPFADQQPQQFENPFDDYHDTTRRRPSEESYKSVRKNSHFQHRQSHSQSSYFTYASRNSYSLQQQQDSSPSSAKELLGGSTTLPSSLNSSGFAKIPKEDQDGMMMMELLQTPPLVVEQDQDPSVKDSSYNNDRASTTLSIKSNTFSLLAMDTNSHGIIDEEEEGEHYQARLPRHQRLLDNNVPVLPPRHNLDEGRSIALHSFNSSSRSAAPPQHDPIPPQPKHRLLNNKATSNSLSRHFRNMSQPSLRTQPSKINLNDNMPQAEVQQAIKLEIKSYLMRADLESTTRAQVKQHLKEVFGATRINESDVQLMQFITDCIEEITFEFLS